MRNGNLALTFLVELLAFAGLAYAGAELGSGIWAVVLAVLLPLAAIAVWGRWNAPRSSHRLPTGARIGCELAVYAVAAVLLAVAGAAVWALALVALVVVNVVLLTVWGQWDT